MTSMRALLLVVCSCSASGPAQTPGHPDVPGTVFTIVFENEAASAVLTPQGPFFSALSKQFGTALAYTSSAHPSCPNYIVMTSGSTNGVTNDNDPGDNIPIAGLENLPAQLDAAGIAWRAYGESMGTPCNLVSDAVYTPRHVPFLYYSYVAANPVRCAEHVVDYAQSFAADLASGAYRYMWITPNICDDMHDCSLQVADAWLQKTVTQIQASDAYKNGGAIFILFDEGSSRLPGATADLATLVVSPKLVSPGFTSQTPYNHASYLATVEDIFGMPRLETTQDATAMDEFFQLR